MICILVVSFCLVVFFFVFESIEVVLDDYKDGWVGSLFEIVK